MKILVTGANGYIGSHVVKELLRRNHTVIATDVANKNIDKRAKTILLDIFNSEDVFNQLDCPDVVIHLAWRNGFDHNSDNYPYHYSEHTYDMLAKKIAEQYDLKLKKSSKK